MTQSPDGRDFVFPLEGRISSSNADALAEKLDDAAREAKGGRLVLDAENLEYISSAGLRVLLRAAKALGSGLTVRGVSPEVYEIFETTGFTSLMNVEKKLRKVSVEGCEVIGTGAYGTVYRIDEDTIVKVYNTPDALPMIQNEHKRAKQAFLKGIPTAISYSMVLVDDRYGSMVEMLKAKTFIDPIRDEPERLDERVRQYAEVIRLVHGVEAEPGELPDCRDVFAGYVEALAGVLPADMAERLTALIRALPEDRHFIHGDFHMKNVMLSDGQPMLIDLDTLSVGNPVFDFAGIFVAYRAFVEDDPDDCMKFLGISAETVEEIWNKTTAYYLGDQDESARRESLDSIMTMGYLRFLYLVAILKNGDDEFREARIRTSIEKLTALLGRVRQLAIHPSA